jgi:hypothetical protein
MGTCVAKDIREFRAWSEDNYPGVKIHPGDWPKTVERAGFVKQARTWYEFFLNGKWGLAVRLLLGVTAIVGGLTKFSNRDDKSCMLAPCVAIRGTSIPLEVAFC